MRMTILAPVPPVQCAAVDAAAAADVRTLSGLALPYGVVGRTSAGPVTVRAGAVAIPDDLGRVKLFTEHGRTTPVGYAVGATETRDGLRMSFRVAATPAGDAALLEASEHVRDALSVELDNVELDGGQVLAAELTAVALCSIPAFADARLVASASAAPAPTIPTPPADADDDDDDDEDENMPDTAPTTPPAEPAGTPPAAEPAAPAAATSAPVAAAAPAATLVASRPPGSSRRPAARRRGLSLSAAMEHVVTMIGGSSDANTINAALSDIVPAADTSDGAWIRPQWVDELWTPVDQRRPYANSVTRGELTGMRVHGWKWGTRPVVGPYAGNKTEIPSGPVTFGPAEADAVRHAGGWDLDNVWVYLGDASLLRAILDAAAMDYAAKQEAYISTTIAGDATAAAADSLSGALSAVGSTLAAAGARPSFVAVAPDLWGDLLDMPTSEAPWWLNSSVSASLSLVDGTAAAADLRMFVDPTLAAGHILAGDRRAVTFYEPRGNPFRVQAVNLPNGGVDIGVFGFCAALVNDSRGIVDVTVTYPVVP